MVIVGIAHGGNIPSLHTAVAGVAPLEYRAAFMSINSTVLRLGQTIGPPLMAIIFLSQGFNVTFYVSGAIAIFTAILSWTNVASS